MSQETCLIFIIYNDVLYSTNVFGVVPALLERRGTDILQILDLLNIISDLSGLVNGLNDFATSDSNLHLWLVAFVGKSQDKKNRTD
jgi:hypothetical protein